MRSRVLGKFAGDHAGEDLPADLLVLAEAAADEDMVSVQTFAREFGFGAEAADVAHVMLGAGIRATGEMNVDRVGRA